MVTPVCSAAEPGASDHRSSSRSPVVGSVIHAVTVTGCPGSAPNKVPGLLMCGCPLPGTSELRGLALALSLSAVPWELVLLPSAVPVPVPAWGVVADPPWPWTHDGPGDQDQSRAQV